MITSIEYYGKKYIIDTTKFSDLSIPYNFNGSQPNFFNVKPGFSKPFQSESLCYSISQGAGCNVSEINMNIHCTGTHTECVGHLLSIACSVSDCIQELYIPTILLTISPISFSECVDSYHFNVNAFEKVISKDLIKISFEKYKSMNPLSIILRTLPNPKEKQYYSFSKHTPPFFTNDAIRFLSNKVQHLVVDIPSIDRMKDDGILGNHRIFWGNHNDPKGSVNSNSNKTITELAYIPNNIKDGFYFMNLQLPHFQIDAAPSRPIILKPIKVY